MSNKAPRLRWRAALYAAALTLSARAESPDDHIETRVRAEVLVRSASGAEDPGAATGFGTRLQTAERVVPGDVLIYTVEVRNTGRYAVESALVIEPVPKHTVYLADSAVGPGAEVDYSLDGGRSFDSAENLKSPKLAGEYTHIRWRLHNRLKPHSIAYLRFRVQVK